MDGEKREAILVIHGAQKSSMAAILKGAVISTCMYIKTQKRNMYLYRSYRFKG